MAMTSFFNQCLGKNSRVEAPKVHKVWMEVDGWLGGTSPDFSLERKSYPFFFGGGRTILCVAQKLKKNKLLDKSGQITIIPKLEKKVDFGG